MSSSEVHVNGNRREYLETVIVRLAKSVTSLRDGRLPEWAVKS
jgi:hypothetical protein